MLPLGSIVNAIGRTIGDVTAFVVGQPDATIGRLTYLDCRYGVSRPNPIPVIEIGVSLYRTPDKAAARVASTVDDYTRHGATATRTTVQGVPATLLEGGSGAGYGPTVVLADAQRTVVVTLRAGAIAASQVREDLLALAALALDRTAG